MPVLDKESSFYPDSLFEQDFLETADPWWVLQTRSRAEKSIARHLFAEGIPFFLPQHERRRRIQRRTVRSYLPLFPGYLFVRSTRAEFRDPTVERAIVNRLAVSDQLQLTEDLLDIYRMVRSDRPVTAEPRLQPGMTAEIVSGPLAGMSGRVIQQKSRLRFVVAVRFLQTGAAIEVDPEMLSPA